MYNASNNGGRGYGMNLGLVLLTLALVAGLISGYTSRVWQRSPDGLNMIHGQSIIRGTIGSAGFIAILAAIVWGFMNLTWWWVILSFLGVSLFIVPLVVNLNTIGVMWIAQPVFDIACIGLTAYLWVAGPFR
jgi:hypothetical protein